MIKDVENLQAATEWTQTKTSDPLHNQEFETFTTATISGLLLLSDLSMAQNLSGRRRRVGSASGVSGHDPRDLRLLGYSTITKRACQSCGRDRGWQCRIHLTWETTGRKRSNLNRDGCGLRRQAMRRSVESVALRLPIRNAVSTPAVSALLGMCSEFAQTLQMTDSSPRSAGWSCSGN